ncbi:MAG: rhodanese-like domain-containing protein [Cyclobacteriaceae bacterium]
MGILGNLFGGSSQTVQQYLAEGALVIDVRTPGEFQGGHVAGSKNYPLQTLSGHTGELKKMNKKLVLCCASGMRSGQATSMLKGEGIDCVNGGGWTKVNGLV